MKIQNSAVGKVEFGEGDIITFSEGMLGLPNYKQYVAIESASMKPFLRLQCIDEPSIGFLTIDPAYIEAGYKDYVVAQDPEHVLIDETEEIMLLVVCTVDEQGADVTANLQAPVAINHRTMTGRQIILLESPYRLRHSLTAGARRREA